MGSPYFPIYSNSRSILPQPVCRSAGQTLGADVGKPAEARPCSSYSSRGIVTAEQATIALTVNDISSTDASPPEPGQGHQNDGSVRPPRLRFGRIPNAELLEPALESQPLEVKRRPPSSGEWLRTLRPGAQEMLCPSSDVDHFGLTGPGRHRPIPPRLVGQSGGCPRSGAVPLGEVQPTSERAAAPPRSSRGSVRGELGSPIGIPGSPGDHHGRVGRDQFPSINGEVARSEPHLEYDGWRSHTFHCGCPR